MREATREHLQRAISLSETLGEVLLAAGFSETDRRFARCLLSMGTHCVKTSECMGRISQGRPARQVRVLRADGTEAEPPMVRDEAPPMEFVRMERVRAILAGVEAIPIEVMTETETETQHERTGT